MKRGRVTWDDLYRAAPLETDENSVVNGESQYSLPAGSCFAASGGAMTGLTPAQIINGGLKTQTLLFTATQQVMISEYPLVVRHKSSTSPQCYYQSTNDQHIFEIVSLRLFHSQFFIKQGMLALVFPEGQRYVMFLDTNNECLEKGNRLCERNPNSAPGSLGTTLQVNSQPLSLLYGVGLPGIQFFSFLQVVGRQCRSCGEVGRTDGSLNVLDSSAPMLSSRTPLVYNGTSCENCVFVIEDDLTKSPSSFQFLQRLLVEEKTSGYHCPIHGPFWCKCLLYKTLGDSLRRYYNEFVGEGRMEDWETYAREANEINIKRRAARKTEKKQEYHNIVLERQWPESPGDIVSTKRQLSESSSLWPGATMRSRRWGKITPGCGAGPKQKLEIYSSNELPFFWLTEVFTTSEVSLQKDQNRILDGTILRNFEAIKVLGDAIWMNCFHKIIRLSSVEEVINFGRHHFANSIDQSSISPPLGFVFFFATTRDGQDAERRSFQMRSEACVHSSMSINYNTSGQNEDGTKFENMSDSLQSSIAGSDSSTYSDPNKFSFLCRNNTSNNEEEEDEDRLNKGISLNSTSAKTGLNKFMWEPATVESSSAEDNSAAMPSSNVSCTKKRHMVLLITTNVGPLSLNRRVVGPITLSSIETPTDVIKNLGILKKGYHGKEESSNLAETLFPSCRSCKETSNELVCCSSCACYICSNNINAPSVDTTWSSSSNQIQTTLNFHRNINGLCNAENKGEDMSFVRGSLRIPNRSLSSQPPQKICCGKCSICNKTFCLQCLVSSFREYRLSKECIGCSTAEQC